MKRRIKDTPITQTEYRTEFYNMYRKAIEYYLSTPKEEAVYVEDLSLEKKLLRSFLSEDSKIIYFLGKEGIGKTTFLKQTFNVTDNGVTFDDTKDIVYVSISFRGQLIESDIQTFIVNSISGLCTALGEHYNLTEYFYSVDGQNEFYDFILKTNRSLLEYAKDADLVKKNKYEIKTVKLQKGEENNPYSYIGSKLKFLLRNKQCLLRRLIIFIDNIETLSRKTQFLVVRNMLSLFSCTLNTLSKENGEVVASTLLISMRQTTHDRLLENEEINAYKPVDYEYKETPIDISVFFEMKKQFLSIDDSEKDMWQDAYEIITNLANKFNCKYSNMIKNLCNYDFQLMKRCYKKILTNKVWLLRGERRRDFLNMSKTDNLFNNISVIRSIACGNNVVYRGIKSTILPNVLLNDEFKDDSIMCLLILSYFMRKGKMIDQKKLYPLPGLIFGQNEETEHSFIRVIEYFKDIEVLEETYYEGQVDPQKKFLVITPKGREIWNMFTTDSVLLEMYREDYYFQNGGDKSDFMPSYWLMETVGQQEIFMQLFRYINILLDLEVKLRDLAKENNTLSEYCSCFGNKPQCKRLLEGVVKSIEYSGNLGKQNISEALYDLEQKIRRIDM